ncbi:MAG: GYDIA family GHMP kinase [Chitinophagales bacterium]|nr:GYDIA family GHMP kinase [Chitinophagales bacterium]
MEKTFYGRGKLLLTGEYFVLDGALALALPARFGQHMQVKTLSGGSNTLFWVALDSHSRPWLQASFDKRTLEPDNKSSEALQLSKILQTCRGLNPDFLSSDEDVAVQTRLEFPRNWGLGSSSTLIYCLSKWAGVNPYELQKQTVGGSGYDIACADSDTAILYQLKNGQPHVEKVKFSPCFKEQLLFVHLGRKQLSAAGIAHYRSTGVVKTYYIGWLDVLTRALLQCPSIEKCRQIIEEHETYVSEALGLPRIKDTLFSHLPVSAKSLGAWGGDFALLAFYESAALIKSRLLESGFDTILSWDEMIFSAEKKDDC